MEPAESPAEPHGEGTARKRLRRDAERLAASTNPATDATGDDAWLCDWIDAVTWLDTDAAEAAAPVQVRRLRELAAALGKRPLTRAGLKDPCRHYYVQAGRPQGPRPLREVHVDCTRAFLRACNDLR